MQDKKTQDDSKVNLRLDFVSSYGGSNDSPEVKSRMARMAKLVHDRLDAKASSQTTASKSVPE